MGAKRKGTTSVTPAKKVPRRIGSHRTRQTPFESADDTVYTARRIDTDPYEKVRGGGVYKTQWDGYDSDDSTREPMENLVDCVPHMREYKVRVDAQNKAGKDAAKLRREQIVADKAAEKLAAEVAAVEAAANVPAADGINLTAAVAEHGMLQTKWGKQRLPIHKRNPAAIWQHYDLTLGVPECVLCSKQPCKLSGSSN